MVTGAPAGVAGVSEKRGRVDLDAFVRMLRVTLTPWQRALLDAMYTDHRLNAEAQDRRRDQIRRLHAAYPRRWRRRP